MLGVLRYRPCRFSTLACFPFINVSAGAYDLHMPFMCMPLALHQPFALFKQDFLSQYTSVKPYHLISCNKKDTQTRVPFLRLVFYALRG